LYEMAVGRVPYKAETPIAVVVKHISDPLPLPRLIQPEIPEALEHVILKALAKEPEDRFATAGDMVRALQEVAHRAPTARLPRVDLAETQLADRASEGPTAEPTAAHISTGGSGVKTVQSEGMARSDAEADQLPPPPVVPPVPERRRRLKRRGVLAVGLAFVVLIGVLGVILGLAIGRFGRPAGLLGAGPRDNLPHQGPRPEIAWDFSTCLAGDTQSQDTEIFDPGRIFQDVWVGNGCAMRFLSPGKSWLELNFLLDPDVPPEQLARENWSLTILHLTSALDANRPGYSHVRILINGKPVWDGSPGPTGAGPGGLWREDVVNVSQFLHPGPNQIRWDYMGDAVTHYWIKSFSLKAPELPYP
jgi:hypothetical protein